jgi:hypothetical protein
MLTRTKSVVVDTLCNLKSTIIEMNNHMNLVSLYYKSDNNRKVNIIKLCLNDMQLNKIKNKRIIIYNDNDYDYAELLGYERILYNNDILINYNKDKVKILKSIDNNLLDDVTIDLLIDDDDIKASNILLNMKHSQ